MLRALRLAVRLHSHTMTLLSRDDIVATISGPGTAWFIRGKPPQSIAHNVVYLDFTAPVDCRMYPLEPTDIELLTNVRVRVHARVTQINESSLAPCAKTRLHARFQIAFQLECTTADMQVYVNGARTGPLIRTRAAFDVRAPMRVARAFTPTVLAYELSVNNAHSALAYVSNGVVWLHHLPSFEPIRRLCGRNVYWHADGPVPMLKLPFSDDIRSVCFTPEDTLLVSITGWIYEITMDGLVRMMQRMPSRLGAFNSYNEIFSLRLHDGVIAASSFFGGLLYAREAPLRRLSPVDVCIMGSGPICALTSGNLLRARPPSYFQVFTPTGSLAYRLPTHDIPVTPAFACTIADDIVIARTDALYVLRQLPQPVHSDVSPCSAAAQTPELVLTMDTCGAPAHAVTQQILIVDPHMYIVSSLGTHSIITVLENI
jgi:hypothetical protein